MRSARPATTARSCVMRRRPMPSSATRRCRSARIRAWVVTSSAVVASSAISRRGPAAMAMAMQTRWRCPPDSSWGWRDGGNRSGGSSARASASRARARASARGTRAWRRTTSATWSPTVIRGSSAVMGSWNTMPISPPRTRHISRSGIAERSRPASAIRPAATAPSGRSRRTASAVIDLPEPDSPVSASTSPSASESETGPSTGAPAISTRRSRTSSISGADGRGAGRARRAARRRGG